MRCGYCTRDLTRPRRESSSFTLDRIEFGLTKLGKQQKSDGAAAGAGVHVKVDVVVFDHDYVRHRSGGKYTAARLPSGDVMKVYGNVSRSVKYS